MASSGCSVVASCVRACHVPEVVVCCHHTLPDVGSFRVRKGTIKVYHIAGGPLLLLRSLQWTPCMAIVENRPRSARATRGGRCSFPHNKGASNPTPSSSRQGPSKGPCSMCCSATSSCAPASPTCGTLVAAGASTPLAPPDHMHPQILPHKRVVFHGTSNRTVRLLLCGDGVYTKKVGRACACSPFYFIFLST